MSRKTIRGILKFSLHRTNDINPLDDNNNRIKIRGDNLTILFDVISLKISLYSE